MNEEQTLVTESTQTKKKKAGNGVSFLLLCAKVHITVEFTVRPSVAVLLSSLTPSTTAQNKGEANSPYEIYITTS